MFYGGFFGAVVAVFWIIRKFNLDWREVADLFALSLPIGQAIGRIGCFVNGCCFGQPSHVWFAVNYPPYSSIWHVQHAKHLIGEEAIACLPVLPVQLFQSGINSAIWIVLIVAARRLRFKGQLFSLYLILYTGGRFVIEHFRGDYLTTYLGFTISQLICLVLFPTGMILFIRLKRQPESNIPITKNA